MITISLCMIVKNEEAVLARCLDSVKEVVDEIVIVDTGSTDKTKEIAAQYTGLVYDFAWDDNFSAARNASFARATKDYILWLDADDVLLPADRQMLGQLKQTLPCDIDVVMMRYNTAFDENSNPTFFYYRERLIRRGLPCAWKGRVHEAIEHGGKKLYSDIAVTHRSVKKVYGERNLNIYRRQLREGPPMAPRDTFYYARELYYHRYYEQAEQVLTEFLEQGHGYLENNLEACKILAYCRLEQNRVREAMEALSRSFCYDAPRAEFCCELGSAWMKLQNYETAAFWYELARTLPKKEKSGAFINESCYGYLPCIQLCVCYDRLGEHEKACEFNRLAGTYRPNSPAYLKNLEYFERLFSNSRNSF